MIANARMYSVSPGAAALWGALLSALAATAGVPMTVIDHPAPAPLEELWRRTDQGAVFMCGLPFARAEPPPVLLAAPVPSPPEFQGQAQYWSDLVVREDSAFRGVRDTFGKRLALTVPGSQSGCVAALNYFMSAQNWPATRNALAPSSMPASDTGSNDEVPLFAELIAPTITPLGALTAVVQGDADIAPIDSYAFRLLCKYRPDLTSRVRVLGQTVRTAIPPLVASRENTALQRAFLEAHHNASMKHLMDQLLLQRFVVPDASSYGVLRDRFDAASAYWRTHRLAARIHPAFATDWR